MNNITIEKLINQIKKYNTKEIPYILKAYELANILHQKQVRQSGEPYIIHPLSVCYTLATMHADKDTLCAALLHDTIEDTPITKEQIEKMFNKDVAELVDGVTKISKMNFSNKDEANLANTRKIISSITKDVRIIIIKLADRLHNMRTLQYKTEFKQKENSLETLEIFVPLAYYIGAYKLKTELEDLSFKYLNPSEYNKITKLKKDIICNSATTIKSILNTINNILDSKNIGHSTKVRIKNTYGIYKRLSQGHDINNIHDLISIKIIVNSIDDCYRVLGLVHSKYHQLNSSFKDYLYNPKENMYKSIHTTIFTEENILIQIQIRTHDMEKVNNYGITSYWDINKGKAREKMQQDIKEKFLFSKALAEIDSINDDTEFLSQVKNEVFGEKIYVYTANGKMISLPIGSRPVDFAYAINTKLGDTIVGAIVNDKYVSSDYVLQNNDRIKIITDKSISQEEKKQLLESAITNHAKTKILNKKENCK